MDFIVAPGTLYIVATPIGNLQDLTPRAIAVLSQVDKILAEDTREATQLLNQFGIAKPVQACHQHNESSWRERVVAILSEGGSLALVSDRGTPLISDPGYPLVNACHEAGLQVSPIPGSCALVAALSVAGLPTDRFAFEGFLPAKAGLREKRLQQLANEQRTLVFYEAPHRILDTIRAMQLNFGAHRKATLARELTKRFETIVPGDLQRLECYLLESPQHLKGEFVICVAPDAVRAGAHSEVTVQVDDLLRCFLQTHPVKQAAQVVASLTGLKKNVLYQRALLLQAQC